MSCGNTIHDLTIMSNTVVTLLKSTPSYNSMRVGKGINKNVAIEDCIKYDGTVGKFLRWCVTLISIFY